MVDPHLQERFTRRCTEAAFGYSAATTAAYAAFAEQVFGFWAGMFEPPRQQQAAPSPALTWGWPVPPRQEPAPMPFLPFFWAAPPPRRQEVHAFPFAGFPFAAASPAPFQTPFQTPFQSPFQVPFQAPFQSWLDMWSAPPASWPMAFMLIASGMPRSVAWPTAEANVAVMDAADAAAVSVRQVFSSYRSDGGHSMAQQQVWPPAQLMMLAAFMPLGLGAMLSSMRVA